MSHSADIAIITTTTAGLSEAAVKDAVEAPPPAVETFVVENTAAEPYKQIIDMVGSMASEHRAVLVFAVDRPLLLQQFVDRLRDDQAQLEQALEMFLANRPPLSERVLAQASRNIEARQEVIDRYGAFTALELARRVRSSAKNSSQTAYRWRQSGQVFAVPFEGDEVYLSFQFGDDNKPLPVVRQVLEVLDAHHMDAWSVAHWFATRTGALDDRRPAEVLQEDPDAVVRAAHETFASQGF